MNSIEQRCVDTIRFLSVDQVEKANSGHPGMPLGAAPMAYVLWDRHLRFNPRNPRWFDRDRFILSAGHGSALLYSLLHLYGYDLPMEELQNFRQWGSKTPGHPEYGDTPGVEATTGPLGQGFAMGVGMAAAEAHLAARFNKSGVDKIVDHYTYAIVSDGDLMEGIACEAASLAGTLNLGKLIYLYDDNRITIEGSTDLAFTEYVDARFASLGWHVQGVEDGNDLDAIDNAINAAKSDNRPSLIVVRTHIGYGSPKQDSEKSHGEPLGEEAMKATRDKLGWPLDKTFVVPEGVKDHCAKAVSRGEELEKSWNEKFAKYEQTWADEAGYLRTMIEGNLPEGWADAVPTFSVEDGPMATRSASGKVLNALAGSLPTIFGGSADLGGSNKSELSGEKDFGVEDMAGRNIHFGVREHAMGGMVNGMALHGGVIPYGATFLIFSDYMRPSIRLSALMRTHSTFIFTHDSIGLGEDGPTHQPIEHLSSLRAIPGFTLFRPADANETAAAWRLLVERRGPGALALTRQNVPVLNVAPGVVADGVARGAYVVSESKEEPAVVLVATGSEVVLAIAAQRELEAKETPARVVSMPSWELFREQPASYRNNVLPPGVPKLAIEAASPHGWRDIIGDNGDVLGLDRFGASAPGGVAMDELGFNVPNVVARAVALTQNDNSEVHA